MESFFRRMSSIVRKSSNKSSCDNDEIQIDNEDNNEQQQQFRQMQQRRRSAPDIRRRGVPVDQLSSETNKKVTSFEQINSQNLASHCYTTGLVRKNYHSSGKSIEMHRFF